MRTGGAGRRPSRRHRGAQCGVESPCGPPGIAKEAEVAHGGAPCLRFALERVETALPSPREAALLGATTSMPVLMLNRRTVDDSDHPIELVRALDRGDRVAFEALVVDR